nr:efflux RND transporter periplasmic adaptor subunit [Saprospiraceae bacterium]
MKNAILIFLALAGFAILSSCGGETGENSVLSTEEKKDKLREKRKQLKNLEESIRVLEAQIEKDENGFSSRDVTLVQWDTLRRKDLKRHTVFQGSIQSRNRVNASPELSGTITQIHVEEGQTVSRGQLIASLNTEVLDRQMAEVETSLGLARDVFERQQRLWNQNIGSEIQYLEAKNSVERLEKNLEVLESQKSKALVKAPQSGVIDQLVLRTGELASPGVPIAVIIDTRNLKLEVNVPENYLPFVHTGDEVEIHIPSLDQTLNTKISRIGSTIDPENRTFVVETHLPQDHSRLMPNLMASLAINDRTATDAIVVPLHIVQYEIGGKAFVYIAKKEGDRYLAEKRYVSTGLSYRNQIEIKTGLEEGDLLISEGQQDVSSGQLLKTSE